MYQERVTAEWVIPGPQKLLYDTDWIIYMRGKAINKTGRDKNDNSKNNNKSPGIYKWLYTVAGYTVHVKEVTSCTFVYIISAYIQRISRIWNWKQYFMFMNRKTLYCLDVNWSRKLIWRSSNLIYRLNEILIKIPASYFVGTDKLILKFYGSCKRTRIINTIFNKNNNDGGLPCLT